MGVLANNAAIWAVDWTSTISGSPSYTNVGEIVEVNFGGITADALDDTVHGNAWRTFTAGLKNGGTVDVTARFGPATHAALLDNVGVKAAHKFTFPKEDSSASAALSIEWDGILTSVGLAAPHDNLLEATVTLTLSGAPTVTDEA